MNRINIGLKFYGYVASLFCIILICYESFHKKGSRSPFKKLSAVKNIAPNGTKS